MKFSQRRGIQPLPARLRPDQMSQELRASLWNALHMALWDTQGFMYDRQGVPGHIMGFAKELWFRYFRRPFSEIPRDPRHILRGIEQYFLTCRWNEVYDFVEAVLGIHRDAEVSRLLNEVLEREIAPYRLVGGRVVDITDTEELAALDEALQAGAAFAPVAAHFQRALELLSDRGNPDFRNSIKESISAVEATARILTGKDTATLGDALKLLERDHQLHKALKDAFSKLYGYTSDEDGIRHAMLDEPDLRVAEAKYFLLSCTSFVNYLKARVVLPA